MDLFFYIIASAIFILTIHFALAIRKQFNVFLMGGFFVIGYVVGWFLQSLEIGFVIAVVLSLVFW